MMNVLIWGVVGMLVGLAAGHVTRTFQNTLPLLQISAGCLGALLGGTVLLIFDTAPLAWFRMNGLVAALIGALIVLSVIHLTIVRIGSYLDRSDRLEEGSIPMTDRQTDSLRGFDLLSHAAQQRLQARIADANGNIAVIAAEIRAQLESVDQAIIDHPDLASTRQADRAFAVAQLSYLDLFAAAEQPADTTPQRGWLTRLQDLLRRPQSAK